MSDGPRLRFEPLAQHDRSSFRCGDDDLDRWFKTQAGQEGRRHVARVFVAVDDEGIAGFYSLSMFSIRIEELPIVLAKKLPRYGLIPAALIGRLARHERLRGKRIGEVLVADAVARVVAAESSVAAWAIVVDAKNDGVSKFYRALGFEPFPTQPLRLFMTMADATAAVAKAG
jgi:ribosomal protein S18 acetylase RimI-like enzyme